MILAELVELRRKIPPVEVGKQGSKILFERFLLPPFSVLNSREGWWQKRKKAWIEMGVESGNNTTESNSQVTKKAGKSSVPHVRSGSDNISQKIAGILSKSGTSTFDPVVCELAYRWFCPPTGAVLDPFAGSSVGGIMAALLGRSYNGIDIRPEQVEVNNLQADKVCPDAQHEGRLEWRVGDSLNAGDILAGRQYDLLFSCPPYADLETYSDDPRDLSNMNYNDFLHNYRRIIMVSCSLLRDDRFAVFVVGDVRDKKTGYYRGFVGDTVTAFRDAGLHLHSQAILVTHVGSLSVRVGKQFTNYRKIGTTHQHILVFLKGDAGRATEACGQVDVDDMEMPELPEGPAVALCINDVQSTIAESYVLVHSRTDVNRVDLPHIEACLLCDVVRGQERLANRPLPRCWISDGEKWVKVDDQQELTYLVGDKVFLNKQLFPEAPTPKATPLQAGKLRGM